MAATPTIKEIAKRLNISISTVSRALNNNPAIGLWTRMRVEKMAKELNYEPNRTAIFFQQKKTFTLGVVIPELSEAFFATAISGIEDTADNKGYIVLMGQSHDDQEREKKIIRSMKDRRVDGILVSISKNTTDFSHFDDLKKIGIPVVFFDRIPGLKDIHCVACNMKSGTVMATDFLLKKKYRKIGMINGPEKLYASRERKEGYMAAMVKNRLKVDPNLIVSSDLTTQGIYTAMDQLLSLKRKPDAIIAFNDYAVLDAVQYARQQGLVINKDITFVSYANLSFSSHAVHPPLASVEQFPYEQAQKATEILLELIDSKTNEEQVKYKQIIIEPKLVVHK
ncbi:MAG: LacI family DNA-binding transcriptional regulator [Ferruginibacter sp.]